MGTTTLFTLLLVGNYQDCLYTTTVQLSGNYGHLFLDNYMVSTG